MRRATSCDLHIVETSEPAMRQLPNEVPIDGSLAGSVWQKQEPLVIRDIQQETLSIVWQGKWVKYPVRSVCSLPLTTVHQRLGVLSMASEKPGVYDQLDLEFAQLVAAQIAVAVEALCHQHQLAHERDRSQLLLEVNNMLVSNLNLRRTPGGYLRLPAAGDRTRYGWSGAL